MCPELVWRLVHRCSVSGGQRVHQQDRSRERKCKYSYNNVQSFPLYKGDLILFLIPGVKFASNWEQAQARMYVMSKKYMHDVLVISVNKTHHWLMFTSNIVCLCLVLMMMRIFDIVFH